MIQRDVSRESAAEILWTCRPQGDAGRLLSKGFFHPRIHQVMLVCHVRNIQSSRPTRRCSHRIWAGIRGGHRTHCFFWLVVVSEFLSPRNTAPSGPRKNGKRRNTSITKKRDKERDRESKDVCERVGHQSERRMDTVAKVRCWKTLSR